MSQEFSQEKNFIDALFGGGANIGPNDGITGLDQATIDAINLNNVLDSQGDIQTFDVNDEYSDSELMESDTTSGQNFIDYLQDLSGGVVNFGKDIAGRSILSKALAGAGSMINPIVGIAGGIYGALKGGNLFDTPYIGADSSITGTPLAQFAFRNQLRRDPSFDIAAALNKQNAAGGYYSDFARGQRQLANRFSNLIDRAQSGKTFSTRNLLGISNALGMGVTQDDVNKIVSGDYNLNTGDGPSGAGTFTAESLSRGFDSEEGPSTSSNYEDFDTMYAKGGIVSL